MSETQTYRTHTYLPPLLWWDRIPAHERSRVLWQLEVMDMEIIDAAFERSQIEISREELLIVNAALNEICNGIDVFEFETRIGADRHRVAVLLKEVGRLLDTMDSR